MIINNYEFLPITVYFVGSALRKGEVVSVHAMKAIGEWWSTSIYS
jgi:hypothetical protein